MPQEIDKAIWEEFEKEVSKGKDFDVSKLNLSSEDSNVLEGFFKKFLDPSETFPAGDRHNVIEKNFAIYILKNKLDIETIKEAYQSKGFNPSSLLSQIQGVQGDTGSIRVFYGDLIKKYFSTKGAPLPPLPPSTKEGELNEVDRKAQEELNEVRKECGFEELPIEEDMELKALFG